MKWIWLLAAAFPFAIGPLATANGDPQFDLPVTCTLGQDCFVQQYVDTDITKGAKDFTCGSLSYDGHSGTDIRLRNYVAMDAGVEVNAAAAGVVRKLRDGMPDISVREGGRAAIKGREGGNLVVLDHGGGWLTLYAHMKKGSVAVKLGQQVQAGARLGEVGLSGDTEFPHLHFEIAHDGKLVDPFSGALATAGCGLQDHPLWKQAPPYIPTALLSEGFAVEKPEGEMARHGAYSGTAFTIQSPALVFWIDVFGLQAGDHLVLSLTGPDGGVMAESDTPIDRPKAQFFAFAGAKHPEGGWKAGAYTGKVQVVRGDQIVAEQTSQIALP
jgi:hypothetical protein